MRNITFSAEDEMIEAARERAQREKTTLNEEFRRWLAEYANQELRVEEAMRIIDEVRLYAGTGGRRFSHDEMNER